MPKEHVRIHQVDEDQLALYGRSAIAVDTDFIQVQFLAQGGQGQFKALPIRAAYVGYQHWWTERLRSTATYGVVYVDNLDIQAPDAYHQTRRWTLNLAWSPIARLDIVAELLGGERIDKDGQRGEASQIQIGTTFRF